jgi:hypothetical protein
MNATPPPNKRSNRAWQPPLAPSVIDVLTQSQP